MCQTFSAYPSLANVNFSWVFFPLFLPLLLPPPTTFPSYRGAVGVCCFRSDLFCSSQILRILLCHCFWSVTRKIFVFHFWFNLIQRKFSGYNQCLCCFLLISRLDSLVQISSCWTAAHLDCDGVAALSKTRSILHWQLTQHKLFW